MKTEINESKYINLKVRVKFAEDVFKKCFEKAGIKFDGPHTKKYAPELAVVLHQFAATMPGEFEEPDSKFIRSKVSKIYEAIANGSKAIPFRSGTLAIFLKYGEFEKELALLDRWEEAYFPGDETAQPEDLNSTTTGHQNSIKVLYTPKAFKTFSLMRTIIAGQLSRTKDGWEYHDAQQHFSGSIENLEIFAMPGERQPFWLKVIFKDQQTSRTIYFAEGHSTPQIPVTTTGSLYRFLSVFFSE